MESLDDKQADNWTLKRYKLKVSFEPHKKKVDLPDHRKSDYIPKCIAVEVFTKALFKGKYHGQESESDHPSGEETCIYGSDMLCFTEKGDAAVHSGMPWLRKIGAHTGSPSSLKVAKDWLDQCVAAGKSPMGIRNEGSGASSFLPERPTRLLEILGPRGSDPRLSTVRLINTHGGAYPYAALSYCWGGIAGAWLTNTTTITQHLRGIKRSDLPATINDAIDVAAALGIGYIWVDALCIIQDSQEDWKVESAKMGGIYQGGLVTIAASKSASSDEGCFNRSEAHRNTVFSDYINVPSRLQNGSTSNLYFAKSIDSVLELKQGQFGSDVERSPLS
ncbi:hypothetical protein OPT61_g10085 [Boeremia exigua]|uniref:Uncharacterized protein n=1 Tax=Boeremia exigua TaxID=749465 RepID=A0ACC2HRA0_9PLEO|nr:hypothetical protein OPT61_g10085 [Boeremia exigua]